VKDNESRKQIARAAYFPHIKNESTLLHVTELAGVEIPAGAFGVHPSTGLIPEQDLFIGQGGLTSYTSGTGLLQPITQILKIHAANRAASADVNTAKVKVDQAENEVALKVRQLYYGVLIAQLKRQAASDEVAAGEAKERESTSAVQEGRALDVVYLESHAALLDAKQAALTQNLQIDNLTMALNDILGLPLHTRLHLDETSAIEPVAMLSREECARIAEEQNPEVRAAQQAVLKAQAGLSAAKYEYVPDVTGVARYSYQSGVPLLAHNFGTFGVTFTYDLFDGGRRGAEIKHSRTLLSQAELNLEKVKEEAIVQMQTAYNKVEQLQDLVTVAEEAMKVRMEVARLTERQYEQNMVLVSARTTASAKSTAAKAAYFEAVLGLTLAQADLKKSIGLKPQ
jgi:outer membrane protein TolC